MQAHPFLPTLIAVLLSVNTLDARTVERRVVAAHQHLFPGRDSGIIPAQFAWVESIFVGRDPEFLPIDALYHDLEHTLQGTLVLAVLLHQRGATGEAPQIAAEEFERAILAILIHDTGYLKRRDDPNGTGAKYTFTHVQRSCDFAAVQLERRGYSSADIAAVQNMIRCTGLGAATAGIPFANDAERVCGFALGTADLVGQMAASDYPDKLPVLYAEFKEALEFSGGSRSDVAFDSAEDLISKTPGFWREYVLPKLAGEFLGLHRHLEEARNGQRVNPYFEAVEANLRRLEFQGANVRSD